MIAPTCTPANCEFGIRLDALPVLLTGLELLPQDKTDGSSVPAPTKAVVPRNLLLDNFSDVVLLFLICSFLILVFEIDDNRVFQACCMSFYSGVIANEK